MTDEQLEALIADIEVVQHHANSLVELQDFIDQIELMARLVSYYGHQHDKDTNDLQVRMIRRVAEMGSKLLRTTEQAIESSTHGAMCTAREIYLQRMREKDQSTYQCQCSNVNLLQVIKDKALT